MFGDVAVEAGVGKGFGIIGIGVLSSQRRGNEICVILVSDNSGTWVHSSSICEKGVVGVVCGEWV